MTTMEGSRGRQEHKQRAELSYAQPRFPWPQRHLGLSHSLGALSAASDAASLPKHSCAFYYGQQASFGKTFIIPLLQAGSAWIYHLLSPFTTSTFKGNATSERWDLDSPLAAQRACRKTLSYKSVLTAWQKILDQSDTRNEK